MPTQVDKTDDEAVRRKRAVLAAIIQKRGKALLNRGAVLKGDPNKHYCWISDHEEQRVYYAGLGYKMVNDPKVETAWKKEDGTHKRGDAILYEIAKDEKEIIDFLACNDAVEARGSSEDLFRNFAEQHGVPTFSPEDRN